MQKANSKPMLTVREVAEQDRGDSWKLMVGVYALSERSVRRPSRGVRVIRAGTTESPAPRN